MSEEERESVWRSAERIRRERERRMTVSRSDKEAIAPKTSRRSKTEWSSTALHRDTALLYRARRSYILHPSLASEQTLT